MESYKYPKPIKVIGWHYCDQKEFQPCADVKNILFAPEHPHSTGYMLAEARVLNKKVYHDLIDLPFNITVRYINLLFMNGLDERSGVKYQRADMTLEGSINAIDEADLIVTYPGTFASLAIARGKPVVMYGQNICPHDGYSDATLRYVHHWEDYQGFMRYHYDISDTTGSITESIIRRASMNEETMWRDKFIGEQMKADTLMDALKGL